MANSRWIIGVGSVTNKWLGFPLTRERAGWLGVASLPPRPLKSNQDDAPGRRAVHPQPVVAARSSSSGVPF